MINTIERDKFINRAHQRRQAKALRDDTKKNRSLMRAKEKDEIEAKLSLHERFKDYISPALGHHSKFSTTTDAFNTKLSIEDMDAME